ncbi:MAG TPA: pitrilysin family protein [Burkholderiales bacterium]|nr:pitrilysin family protein [Burkholderiales bacterium]
MRMIRALVLFAAFLLPAVSQAELQIEQWQTDTGARVLFVESRGLPILDVSVEFPAGSARDTADRSGVASLTLRMMRLGAAGMSEDAISEKLADVGANLSSRLDVDRAGYSLRSLSGEREREQALAVLRAVLQAPEFPETALEREKARVVAALRDAATRPATIAERNFRELVFHDHPYGLPGSGEIETVAAISRGDLQQFHRLHFTASAAVVAIIGDVSREEAQRIAAQLTRRLPQPAGAVPPLPAVAPLTAPAERWIPHPATQAHIRVGMPGLQRADPDYFALWLGNHILGGGGFSSRLTVELREKRGLSYSSYSYFAPYAERGAFLVGVQTQKEQAGEALAVVRATLERFVTDGPTPEEIEAAKQNVVGGFVLRVDSNSKMHEYLAMIGFYGLPLDYIDTFPERIAALSVEQVADAFRRRVDPANMVTVVVGPESPR